MKQLIQSEFDRLVMRRRTMIILILSVLAFLCLAFFNSMFGVGFYDPYTTASLDALNFAPFMLRDYHFYFVLILCPLLVVETFNRERYSGEYRMVMIRPYSKLQLYQAKIITLAILMGIFTFVLWIVGIGFANMMLPSVRETSFFEPQIRYTSTDAILFSLKFYIVEYMIIMSVIGVMSLISLLLPNTIFAFLGSIFVVCIVGFGFAPFEFLMSSTRSIFDLLLGMGNGINVILYVLVILGIGMVGSYAIFRGNDYLS